MWSWLSARNRTSSRDFGRSAAPGPDDSGRAGENNVVPELRHALPQIAAEFARARRYERTVTIAVFSVAPADASASPHGGKGGSTMAALAAVVRQAVREIDLVTADPATRSCIVVMPEIGSEEGQRALGRMRQLCADKLACPIRADLAVFPQDGWMFLDLVDVARRHARNGNEARLVPLVNRTA